jgi:fatty-acid peroxygenase
MTTTRNGGRNELSLGLVRDRYRALSRLRDAEGGADSFPLRMLGRRGVAVRGEHAVRTFYDPEVVRRKGAVPAPVRVLLFGPGSLHGLDGAAHARRKRLFLDIVDDDAASDLARTTALRLDRAIESWCGRDSVRLYDELVRVYGAAVLEWAGTGTAARTADRVIADLASIVDGFGVGGSSYPRALLARARAQRWALGVIRRARAGRDHPPEGSATAVLSAVPREELSDLVAATELLNVVRPTVAVAYFGAYAAQAVAAQPSWRERLAAGDPDALGAFEHEIRRWYPFTPLLTGRLRRRHNAAGVGLRPGSWMVLDVIGTNRDPRLWERPDDFDPSRFLQREPTAYDYVPQGGGDPSRGHRCPGEPLAAAILEVTLQRLARLDFELGESSGRVPLDRIPSLPPDGVTLRGVRAHAS